MRDDLAEFVNQPDADFAGSSLFIHLDIAAVPEVTNLMKRGCNELVADYADRMPSEVDIKHDLSAYDFIPSNECIAEPLFCTLDRPVGLTCCGWKTEQLGVLKVIPFVAYERHDSVQVKPSMASGRPF